MKEIKPYQDEQGFFEIQIIYITWNNIHLQEKSDVDEKDLPRLKSEEAMSSQNKNQPFLQTTQDIINIKEIPHLDPPQLIEFNFVKILNRELQ